MHVKQVQELFGWDGTEEFQKDVLSMQGWRSLSSHINAFQARLSMQPKAR